MAGRIEDYALIGDMQTAALVCRDGTADWLCLPRFDSHAVFAGLLGTEENGFWRLGPAHASSACPPDADRRRYRGDSLILESEWDTPRGTVRVTDFMPPRDGAPAADPDRRGRHRARPDALGAADALQLRPGRALGPQGGRPHGRRRRPRFGVAGHLGRHLRQGPHYLFRLHRRPWRPGRFHDQLGALAQGAARASRAGERAARHRGLLARMGRAVHLPRPLPRSRGPLADHPQGAHLRPDRRDRCRSDHLAARGHRRCP